MLNNLWRAFFPSCAWPHTSSCPYISQRKYTQRKKQSWLFEIHQKMVSTHFLLVRKNFVQKLVFWERRNLVDRYIVAAVQVCSAWNFRSINSHRNFGWFLSADLSEAIMNFSIISSAARTAVSKERTIFPANRFLPIYPSHLMTACNKHLNIENCDYWREKIKKIIFV